MKYRHSVKYVENIISDANLTTRDVECRYYDYYRKWLKYNQVVNILRDYNVDSIYYILKIKK